MQSTYYYAWLADATSPVLDYPFDLLVATSTRSSCTTDEKVHFLFCNVCTAYSN